MPPSCRIKCGHGDCTERRRDDLTLIPHPIGSCTVVCVTGSPPPKFNLLRYRDALRRTGLRRTRLHFAFARPLRRHQRDSQCSRLVTPFRFVARHIATVTAQTAHWMRAAPSVIRGLHTPLTFRSDTLHCGAIQPTSIPFNADYPSVTPARIAETNLRPTLFSHINDSRH